jgi:hypothetical protein
MALFKVSEDWKFWEIVNKTQRGLDLSNPVEDLMERQVNNVIRDGIVRPLEQAIRNPTWLYRDF